MATYHRICVLYHSDTYYNYVKCQETVCNRPDCSTSVDESHTGYSEDHPKAVSICKSCSGSKKRQSSVSTFFRPRFVFSFITQRKNARILVLVCLYLACISPYLDLSPNTDKYKLYKAVYGSFHTMLIKKNCRECHKIVQLYISKYFP